LGLPLFRGPGALETAPALSTTTPLTLLCTPKLKTDDFPGQVLPFVAEPGGNLTHDSNTQPEHPLPSRQHLPPLGRALKLPPHEPTPIPHFPIENANFRPQNSGNEAELDVSCLPPDNSSTAIKQPSIAFKPTYVLAYSPFDAMD